MCEYVCVRESVCVLIINRLYVLYMYLLMVLGVDTQRVSTAGIRSKQMLLEDTVMQEAL